MKLSALLAPMVARGVDAATILATVQAWEDQQQDALEQRRANDRARQERHRHVTSRDVTVTASSRERVTRVEDKTSNLEQKEERKEEQKQDAQARDVSDFKAEFSDLDPERLAALIKHRRSKRGQITGLSARLFREAADNCGLSLSQAVDTCIDRNWITLKPEWLNKPQARGSPPQKQPNLSELFALKDRMERNDADYQGPQSEPVVRYLPSAGRG